jgi:hypothetical protein
LVSASLVTVAEFSSASRGGGDGGGGGSGVLVLGGGGGGGGDALVGDTAAATFESPPSFEPMCFWEMRVRKFVRRARAVAQSRRKKIFLRNVARSTFAASGADGRRQRCARREKKKKLYLGV